MLSEDELEAIAERARLASPGPWLFEPDGLSSAGGIAVADPTQTTGYRRVAYVAPMGVGRFGKDSRGFWKDRLRGRERDSLERALANGAFIAAAPSGVPALVDEIARLRARIAELESAVLASAVPSSGVALPVRTLARTSRPGDADELCRSGAGCRPILLRRSTKCTNYDGCVSGTGRRIGRRSTN